MPKIENLSKAGWLWIDDTPFDFTNWDPEEPSDETHLNEQCIEMWTNGLWNDANCASLKPFICQKPSSHSFCAVPGPDRRGSPPN